MRSTIVAGLIILAYSYFGGLAGWLVLRVLFGDRWWWLFLLNALAIYLFLPLPLIALLILPTRRPALWLAAAAALLIGCWLYRGLMLPRPAPGRARADAPAMTLMSYNMLVHSQDARRVLAAIRASGADVVALQELPPHVAHMLQHELHHDYPYQVLEPNETTSGMGVISRYPLRPTGATLPGDWVGQPQILELDFAGETILLLNIHARSTSLGYGGNLRIAPAQMEASIRERERQMQTLAEFAAAHPGPLLLAGDLNTGDQSRAYATIARVLRDAWPAAGYGPGHTFPGAATPGSSRPSIAGIKLPMWLVRIDYIFSSQHWQAQAAHIGPWDGMSDHRPVVAQLALLQRQSPPQPANAAGGTENQTQPTYLSR